MDVTAEFFDRPVAEVAASLIGATFLVDGVGGVLVETEAYDATDAASHSFNGETARNAAMFGPPGTVYVYRSYGIHWCINFVCRRGAAVLIRALEPTAGFDVMAERRGIENRRLLCSGPGRLTQALGVDLGQNGRPIFGPPFELRQSTSVPPLVVGPRIGISRNQDAPWRFGLSGSQFLSKPFAREQRLRQAAG
ncbi:3-methyladenine DNA glycosylase [Devosia geojensis]|uniref:Putative 3-methyladenine DNA glycosylase n=1 Tax=Devosia geojensis TaxID=443610 RepID=A0A0F5FX39_9HYPH|nr:3-methyladenine DNA glycosylase [Devosia geojensis]